MLIFQISPEMIVALQTVDAAKECLSIPEIIICRTYSSLVKLEEKAKASKVLVHAHL